jgi:hypothetical protein
MLVEPVPHRVGGLSEAPIIASWLLRESLTSAVVQSDRRRTESQEMTVTRSLLSRRGSAIDREREPQQMPSLQLRREISS